jgi:polar amino acid transport system substrate-binding protein
MKNDLGKTKLSISRRDFILHASALSGSFGVIANANHAVARPFDDVVASGILRVALYAENPPFSEVIDGSPVGIDVDLARVVAERLGLEIKITIVDAAENVDGDLRMNLTRGDLAGSGVSDLLLHVPHDVDLALRNNLVFTTTPYFQQKLGWIHDSRFVHQLTTLQDITSFRVAVEGTSAIDTILMLAEDGRYRNCLSHFRTFSEAFDAYRRGEIPILAGHRSSIEAARRRFGLETSYNIISELELPGISGIKSQWDLCGAVSSGSRDLAYKVGSEFGAVSTDGTLERICLSYGVTLTRPEGY